MKRTLYHVTTLLFPKNAPFHEERRVFRKLSQLKKFLNSTQYHLVGIFKEVTHHRYYHATGLKFKNQKFHTTWEVRENYHNSSKTERRQTSRKSIQSQHSNTLPD